MKKLTKLFSIVLVIAMLVMCMAGCGDKKETAGSDQNTTAGGDASTLYLGGIGPPDPVTMPTTAPPPRTAQCWQRKRLTQRAASTG